MSLLDRVLGKPLASHEAEEQKIGVISGIPTLGLDGLSSAAYGPEAALTLLMPLGAVGLVYIGPIILIILAILAILYLSYRQTMAAYPNGGGSYTVARENLGPHAGLLAAASLMLDYILNVAVGISAGVEALVSAVPKFHGHDTVHYMLPLCLIILALITLINLRGIRESGIAFALPTYVFVGTLVITLLWGLLKTFMSGGHPHPVIAPPTLPKSVEVVSLWLLMRAFASGCTAMTGVEAVSNGIGAFKQPAVPNAQKTLTAIVVILAALLGGIAILCHSYGIGAMDADKPGYQSVISQLVVAVAGRGIFYYVTIGSVLAVLALSANTSFADFPRLARLLALDDYLPHAFTSLGRRLVYTSGIMILTLLSALLLTIFGGVTDRLIPLFAVGAFGAFTLSQAGMVVHWKKHPAKHTTASMLVNGTGAVCTGVALIVILFAKFMEGAWITVLLIPTLYLLFTRIKRHYDHVAELVRCTGPMDFSQNASPLILVPIDAWNILTERALRFSMRLSPDVIAVHVVLGDEDRSPLREVWVNEIEGPAQAAGLPVPRLELIDSPFRRLSRPLLTYIRQLEQDHPERIIAVVIPELVQTHWYEAILHNHRATSLKALLLLYGNQRVVVINVPWYMHPRRMTTREASGIVLPVDPIAGQ